MSYDQTACVFESACQRRISARDPSVSQALADAGELYRLVAAAESTGRISAMHVIAEWALRQREAAVEAARTAMEQEAAAKVAGAVLSLERAVSRALAGVRDGAR